VPSTNSYLRKPPIDTSKMNNTNISKHSTF
jgi:hypothetical protein